MASTTIKGCVLARCNVNLIELFAGLALALELPSIHACHTRYSRVRRLWHAELFATVCREKWDVVCTVTVWLDVCRQLQDCDNDFIPVGACCDFAEDVDNTRAPTIEAVNLVDRVDAMETCMKIELSKVAASLQAMQTNHSAQFQSLEAFNQTLAFRLDLSSHASNDQGSQAESE